MGTEAWGAGRWGAGYLQEARPGTEWVRPKELVPVASSDTWLPVTGGHSEPGFQWACCAPTATLLALQPLSGRGNSSLGPGMRCQASVLQFSGAASAGSRPVF